MLKAKASKMQAESDFAQRSRGQQVQNTVCSFSLMSAVSFLARAAAQIHELSKVCPMRVPGSQGFLEKSCLALSSSFVTSLSQVTVALAAAAQECQSSVTNTDALCTAPIAALFVELSQYIGASTLASSTCRKAAAGCDYVRRLAEDGEAGEGGPLEIETVEEHLRWQYTACGIDATSAVVALGLMALSLNGATGACPPIRGGHVLQDQVSTGICTIGVALTFSYIARLMLFLALGVEHCMPRTQMDALCLAAFSSLLSALFGTGASGAGIYLECQLKGRVEGILLGTDAVVASGQGPQSVSASVVEAYNGLPTGQRRLGNRSDADRRSIRRELVDRLFEANFSTYEDLWLSMGFNLSDANASWLQEDPVGLEILRRGDAMIEELQTSREEPPEASQELGPEDSIPSKVPDVRIDPQDDEGALKCSQNGVAYSLGLVGHAVTLEVGVAACQARCARVPGCARFSYWPPHHHCRLHGVLADPSPGHRLWVSGPPGCSEEQISNWTRCTLRRKHECYHLHATYESGAAPIAEASREASVLDCQRRCQGLRGCAYFTFSEADGLCSLADRSATKLQPVMFSVAGPRHCAEALRASMSAMEVEGWRDSPRPRATAVGGVWLAAAISACVVLAIAAMGLLAQTIRRSWSGL